MHQSCLARAEVSERKAAEVSEGQVAGGQVPVKVEPLGCVGLAWSWATRESS